MLLAEQLVRQRYVRPGPLVLGTAPIKYPAPTTDRDRTVSPFYRRTERGDVVAVADIIAVEVETGFAAVSFPIGDKRADLFIP